MNRINCIVLLLLCSLYSQSQEKIVIHNFNLHGNADTIHLDTINTVIKYRILFKSTNISDSPLFILRIYTGGTCIPDSRLPVIANPNQSFEFGILIYEESKGNSQFSKNIDVKFANRNETWFQTFIILGYRKNYKGKN